MIIDIEKLAKKYALAYTRANNTIINETYVNNLEACLLFLKINKHFIAKLFSENTTGEVPDAISSLLRSFDLGLEFERLVLLFIKHKRLELWEPTINHVIQLYEKAHNIIRCNVYSSHELASNEKEIVVEFIKAKKIGLTLKTTYHIDPSLISGIKIQTDTFLWERSIKRVLNHINRSVNRRVLT